MSQAGNLSYSRQWFEVLNIQTVEREKRKQENLYLSDVVQGTHKQRTDGNSNSPG